MAKHGVFAYRRTATIKVPKISMKRNSPRYLVDDAASGHLSISCDKLHANARACTNGHIPRVPIRLILRKREQIPNRKYCTDYKDKVNQIIIK